MLFNSYEFLFLFLPIVVVGYYCLGNWLGKLSASVWLILASLFFYSWWNPRHLLLLLFSILFNFGFGYILCTAIYSNYRKKILLTAGILINLILLVCFKYSDFIIENLNIFLNSNISTLGLALPLAISFFTFQQITFLVQSYRGIVRETNFLRYCLFITFFPQLIIGPIMLHRELVPQFEKKKIFHLDNRKVSLALIFITVGLFKKVIIADGIGAYSSPVYDLIERGLEPNFMEAWGAAFCSFFQIYFDFSGYSDIAIGTACLFGIKLPVNFYSPYKAVSIIDFWNRWHITLARFLREFVFFPLRRQIKEKAWGYISLAITMILAGIWHGAGWTFVIFGAYQGLALVINHLWVRSTAKRKINRLLSWSTAKTIARLITWFTLIISLVPFTAGSVEVLLVMWQSMAGLNGILILPAHYQELAILEPVYRILNFEFIDQSRFAIRQTWFFIIICWVIVWKCPNLIELTASYSPTLTDNIEKLEKNQTIQLKLHGLTGAITGIILAILALVSVMHIENMQAFIYFRF